MYMGYFKRKRTNKKKGKRGTKRYRGGGNQTAPTEELNIKKAAVDEALTKLFQVYKNKEKDSYTTAKSDFETAADNFVITGASMSPGQEVVTNTGQNTG